MIALLFDWFVIFSSILISVTFNNILIYLVAIILIGSRTVSYTHLTAHSILMQDKKYREAHHCTGFFKTTLPGFYSVVKDICTPNSKMKES